MSALSASDLDAMRDTVDGALPDTCSIVRKSLAPDGHGGSTDTWATMASGVSCRLSPMTSRVQAERTISSGGAAVSQWVITLPSGQDIRGTDRIQIGGRVFEVDTIVARSWELSRRVVCFEVT